MITPDRAIRIIHEHGHMACQTDASDKVLARAVWTDRTGHVGHSWEWVSCTVPAIRAWLGY